MRVIAITIERCAGMEPRKEVENKKILRSSKVLVGTVEGRGFGAKPQ
jgi:hypothetical protein